MRFGTHATKATFEFRPYKEGDVIEVDGLSRPVNLVRRCSEDRCDRQVYLNDVCKLHHDVDWYQRRLEEERWRVHR